MIPYPFGIGADCSVNPWYVVECNSSTPYLPALDHLEVLGVILKSQTVTVNMPTHSGCQNPVRNSSNATSFDLGGSPFLYSKLHNKIVFEGCGVASMMSNGHVVTGCSTACLNVTLGDRNNCFGIGCCQITIPMSLKSYNIHFTGLERQGADRGCGSAFLVDATSYDPFTSKKTTFTPVSLLWTLTAFELITCCDNKQPDSIPVKMFDGTTVNSLRCNVESTSLTYSNTDIPAISRKCKAGSNPYLPDTYSRDPEYQKYAKTGCNDTCGEVRIPYPFGIGADCSVNRWYIVDCNSSKPYLPALNHVEVLKIYTENQTVIIGTQKKSSCQKPVQNSIQTMSIDLGRSPFLFSKQNNKLVFEGCGTASLMDNGNVLAACSAACESVTQTDRNNCFGIGCCQITIPNFLKSYSIRLTNLKEEDGRCPSTFLVDETLYGKGWLHVGNSSFIRISLMWTLTDSDQVTCCNGIAPKRSIVHMSNGTSMDTLLCDGWPYGSPYLIDGCASFIYVDDEDTKYCRRCIKRGGYCDYVKIYDDEISSSEKPICLGEERTPPLRLIL
ncbi:hypothetical protein M8C21_024825, partial [Ambrosia artemisiifolia]